MKLGAGIFTILAVAALGCGSSHPQDPDGSPPVTPDAEPEADGAPEVDSMPVPDAEPPLPDAAPPMVVDCAALPSAPLSTQVLPGGARAYHGIAISSDGFVIGTGGGNLIKANYKGTASVFVPNIGSGEQMDWLSNGNLAFSTGTSLVRIGDNGGYDTLHASANAASVIVGFDKYVYVANRAANTIDRIHHETGARETLVTNTGTGTFKAIEFSLDHRRLYIGTIGGGTVYYVDFDADMNVEGELEVFANNVGSGWHDAIGVDACGNLYVPDYFSRNMYRITPDGTVSLFLDQPNPSEYAHSLVWGTGKYGWRDDALYVGQPYNGSTVGEIVIGVPSRDYTGTVINKPPMLP